VSFEDLMQPSARLERLCDPPVSRLMHLIWQSRADLRRAFDLARPVGQRGLVRWYLANCLGRAGGPPEEPGGREPQRTGAEWRRPTRNLAGIARQVSRRLPQPWRRAGKQIALAVAAAHARFMPRLVRFRSGALPAVAKAGVQRARNVPGFNLIGHAFSELGLGQNLRFVAAALRSAALPYRVVEFSAGVPAARAAMASNSAVRRDNPYDINVFMMSPELLASACCVFGQEFFYRQCNVLYAFWELERWPEPWREWLDLFDEVWVPTRFVEDSVARVAKCPVIRISPCVSLPAPSAKGRADFGLPAGRFLFLTIVDAFSYLERKNPLAAVRAFKLAFPSTRQDVGMVIKVMNADSRDAHWRLLVEECAGDPRFVLINRVLAFEDMVALYRATDCYVSLHRSEGFGLCMAEAMLCGKPVVATRYSGNLDFTLPDNSCLVDVQMVPVLPGQYPFAQGQVWAEPDIAQAAECMRKLRDDTRAAELMGEQGRQWAMERLGPDRAGVAFSDILGHCGHRLDEAGARFGFRR